MHSPPGDALPEEENEHSSSPQPFKKKQPKSLDFSLLGMEDDCDQSFESTQNQLVLYNPSTCVTNQEVLPLPDPTKYRASSSPNFTVPNSSSRVLPSVGAFTVQCALCFKWRLIPTKEKYEEIRENLLQAPFVCEKAREWRPDISCEEPADISQDGSRLWAIDKPNIAQPPPGWERLLRIRGEGSTKFADVYYASPSGKKLRSMVEVQKYLLEHPEHEREGVHLSQFSFQIPRPLHENYCRKRTARMTNPTDFPDLGFQRPSELADVSPLSWAGPIASPKWQSVVRGSSTRHPWSEQSPTKKPRRPKQTPTRAVRNLPKINVEDLQQVSNASGDP